MTTTAAAARPGEATPPGAGEAGFVAATAAVATRHLLKTLRTPPVIILTVLQSVVFLLIFAYVFGGAIQAGPLAYVDYMVPGLLTVGVLFSVMTVGTGVAEDLTHGVTDRFRSLPMPRSAVLAGRVLAQLPVTALALAATTLVAVAVGFRPHAGVAGLAWMLGLCLLAGLAFTWVFVAVGLATGNVQAAQGLGFLVMPLSFVSSAYVPTATMPGWLRVFAEHQPLTVLVNASRYLAHGVAGVAGLPGSGAYYVGLGVLWCAGITAVMLPLCAMLFRRR